MSELLERLPLGTLVRVWHIVHHSAMGRGASKLEVKLDSLSLRLYDVAIPHAGSGPSTW